MEAGLPGKAKPGGAGECGREDDFLQTVVPDEGHQAFLPCLAMGGTL
jgi:hypothetical protein